MPTFTLIQSDNFTRSNTTASANPGSVGNSWVDQAGNVYSIQGNQLQSVSASTSGYATQILTRPSSEQYQDQKVLLNFPGGGQSTVAGSTVLGAVARWQSGTGNHYEAVVIPSSNNAYIYKVVGGTRTQLASVVCSGFDPTHSYSLELDCYGTAPTNLVFTLIDTSASVTRGTVTVTDTETTLQNSTGVSALSSWSVSGASGTTVLLTSAATYYSPTGPTALTLSGPTSGSTGVTSTNFTVSANGTFAASTTITPTSSSTGTFSPTSVILSSSVTSATFTYTASAAATATITVASTGLTSATKTYTSTTPAVATALTITGPTAGTTGVASSSFTVAANGSLSSSTPVTLTTGGTGTFSPASVTLSAGATSATFTYNATTSASVTVTASATGLTSGTFSYTSSAAGAIPTAPIVVYPTPYTNGTTPSTFIPQFGAGDAVAARTIYQVKTGFTDWLDANGYAGRGIITESGIPGSSQFMTEPGPTIAYQGTTYNAGWNNVMQQWFEFLNRKNISTTVWNACEWRVPLEGYTTDDGTSKVINVQQTSTAIVENNISNTIYQRGVNFAGGDFADQGPGGAVNRSTTAQPGAGYYYPLAANFPILAAKGVTLIRYPIRWERVQPNLKQALDPVEMAQLLSSIQGANAAGCKVLLDIHNYARYDTTPTGANTNGVLNLSQNAPSGVSGTMTDCFVDLWQRLAIYFKANAPIWGYDIMNEPHDLPGGVTDWQTASQRAVEAIRVIDQNVRIAVEGYTYANAANWTTNNGSAGWLTETIPAGQTGAGSARNTDPLVLWNAHNYFDTIPNGNDGSFNATGGSYAQELAAATSGGWAAWSTSGYTAPITDITSQTGVRPSFKTNFSSSPGTYNPTGGVYNGIVSGTNTVTAPFTGVGNPTASMKIICSATADEGGLRQSLVGSVAGSGQFDFQIDSSSSTALATTSNFNVIHCWADDDVTDLLEIKITGSGSGYTTTLAIPGSGGATSVGTTILPVGSFTTFKIVVNPTNFQLFVNGLTSPEITLTASNTGKHIGGFSMGKFYGTSPLTMYYTNVNFGNIVTYDARTNGGLMTSSVVSIVNPNVSLTSNVTSGTAPQSLTLTAPAAAGTYPIASVKFYQGGALISTATSAPYTAPVASLSFGSYGFTALVTDTSGNTGSSNTVTVIISAAAGGGGTSVPSINLALSANSASAPATVTLTATPTTTSGYVTLVEFYSASSKIGQSTATPWTYTATALSAGSYQFSAKVTDNNGNTALSTVQTFVSNVVGTPTATPPTISLALSVTSPTPPAAVTLTATAMALTSGATLSNVTFYNGSSVYATVTSSPYVSSITGLAAGTYSFTAVASDSNGSQTTSSIQTLVITPVTVTSGGGTGTVQPAQVYPASTQGVLIEIKNYVANQRGRNDGNVPDPKRDSIINDAREKYYSSRPWDFLKHNGFILTFAADALYTNLSSSALPLDRNRASDITVYDSLGRPVQRLPIDQLVLSVKGMYNQFFAVDEYRNLLLTNSTQPTLFINYLRRVKKAALDGSEDSLAELAPNLTAIKFLSMALVWVAGERDTDSMKDWMNMYQEQYKLDVRMDILNEPIRRYRMTPRGTGFTKRGYPFPPSGYIGRY